jgi:hypothetical protein
MYFLQNYLPNINIRGIVTHCVDSVKNGITNVIHSIKNKFYEIVYGGYTYSYEVIKDIYDYILSPIKNKNESITDVFNKIKNAIFDPEMYPIYRELHTILSYVVSYGLILYLYCYTIGAVEVFYTSGFLLGILYNVICGLLAIFVWGQIMFLVNEEYRDLFLDNLDHIVEVPTDNAEEAERIIRRRTQELQGWVPRRVRRLNGETGYFI